MAVAAATLALALVLPVSVPTERQAEAGQNAQQLEREVQDKLGGRDLRDIKVSVEGSEATLSGRVPHFWAKDQALKRALDVDGIETVASELELPGDETDTDIAEAVGKAIQRYPHHTMWDYITARVDEGKVFLGGWVTPDRDKSGELFERVAKLAGVLDVENTIETLPVASRDRQVRRSIQRQLAFNVHFERIVNMNNPPFHIIVKNGIVGLLGYVQGDIEHIELQRIVGQTQGVLRVENHLEVLQQ